jgi:hypothetical protein
VLLRTVYTLNTDLARLGSSAFPFELELEEDVRASVETYDGGLRVVLNRPVDPEKLEVVTDTGRFRRLPAGDEEPISQLLLIDDDPPEHVLIGDLTSAIAFLSGVPLSFGHPIDQDRFIPESKEDEEILRTLGTDTPYVQTGLSFQTRTLSTEVDAGGVAVLLSRAPGIRLYADALRLTTDVAQFRELWRVLESAFRATDDELVRLLASFPPAQEMEFDADELEEFLVLRGRASHAQSKGGVHELIHVQRECHARLGGLRNLAERVILTKESWGHPTTGVKELARLQAYIGPNGTQHYFQRP